MKSNRVSMAARRRSFRLAALLAVIALIAFGAVAPSAPARAATPAAWSVVPSPSTNAGTLFGVSCASQWACTAAGTSNSGTLIEQWNGSAWSVVPSPNGQPREWNGLGGVSCTSVLFCTAVGEYEFVESNVQQLTLIEQWNGSAWSIVPSPDPGTYPSYNQLNGVSCSSASACTAVGNYSYVTGSTGIGQTLVEQWNGSTWSFVPSPNVSGAIFSSLEGVSCVSATACTAVGDYYATGTSPYQTLIEQWNGTTWSIVPSPNGTAKQDSYLYGVSCMSASDCVAAGYYSGGSNPGETLIEQWNGSTWSIVPGSTMAGTLSAISCASAAACTAVGNVIEQWNGTAWSILPEPSTSAEYGISCPSASACTAAGSNMETSATLPLTPPPAAPPGANALTNPQLTSGSGSTPACWSQAGYGTNTPTYTWSPTGGYAGGEETISMAGYSSGDAKLVTAFDNGACAPTVNPGDSYTLSVWYESTAPVFFTVYGRASGGGAWSYWTQSPAFAPASTWTLATWKSPAVPSGDNGVSFGMTIAASGTVSTSDYSLVDQGSGIPPAAPVGTNALSNPQLNSGTGNTPACWSQAGYGTNTPAYTWSTSGGYAGGEETISMTGYSSGDAKLLTTFDNGACAPTVTAGNTYTLSVWYESTAPVFFTLYGRSASDGTWSYWTQSPTFAPASTWTLATWVPPVVPATINGASFGMTIAANGTLSTSDYSLVNDGSGGVPPPAGVGVNALVNPQLTSGTQNAPTCWELAGYGTNTPTSTWSPTGGYQGGEETISMAGYSSGDAKLVTTFDNGACAPTVNPGDGYTLSMWYESSVPVFFTVYGRAASGGAWSYWTQSPAFAPASTWTLATWTSPAVPAGDNGVSFGMTIAANGTLSTSDYSLVDDGSGAVPPPAGVGVNALVNSQLTSGTQNTPSCWSQAGYGTNTPAYAWSPTGGYAGGEETISMTGYSSGDAKLLTTFDNGACAPTVAAGNIYTLSVWYESSVPVFFTLYGRSASDGSWSYVAQSPTFAPASTWTLATWVSPAVPATINGASFGMTIAANGTLSTSDYSLVNDGSGGVPPAAPIGVNPLVNPQLTSGTQNAPTCWSQAGYGTNTPAYTWSPTGGYAGGEETISMTGYSSGDAKLVTTFDNGACAPTVSAGDTYTLSVWYESTAPVFFTLYGRSASTGAWSYWTQSTAPFRAASTWTLATWVSPIVPTTINGLSFGMTIAANGTLSTSDYSLVSELP